METSPTDVNDQTPGGNSNPLPDQSNNTPADNQAPSDNSNKDNQPTAPEGSTGGGSDKTADEQLQKFAKNIGVSEDKLSDPDVQKLVKLAYDNKASSDRNYQAVQEKEKKIRDFGQEQFKDPKDAPKADDSGYFPDGNYPDPADEVKKRVDQIEYKSNVANFFALNPEAKEHIDTMDEIAKDRPYLYNDLGLLYEIAQNRSRSTDSARDAGRQEERERLAKMQAAGAPSMSANNSAPQSPASFTREQISNMSREEYERNKEAIKQAERDGRVS